ncbi:MAG TPA: FecR domain-containing protein [Candidatus Polarisedimenticolaceae bacterium]|nr:FecR domain-containing protein [Candidatus Polarisedimenticolaceae bacterium]
MPPRAPKTNVLLDWFTVSYRTVVVFVLLAVGLLGLGVWYLFFYAPGKPRQEAQDAISRAVERLAEASRYTSNERVDEAVASARSALGEGRDAFGRHQYTDAQVAAIRSENFSQKAIDMARGEGTTAREVRILREEGDVRVKRAGEFDWQPLDRKSLLRVGDQVKTSSNGSVQLIYFDGAQTQIDPGSLLEIREIHEDPATKVRRVSEKLNWGEIQSTTQKRNVDGSFHEVATDKVSARAEDAVEFRLASDKETKAAAIDVFEGRVQVAAGGRKENVEGGERLRADPSGQLQAKEVLPGAPRLLSPSDQKVFVEEDPAKASTSMSWERVPGAKAYHLMIADRMLFADVRYEADREDTNVVLQGVPAGEYYWKVAAISPSSIRGPFSEVRRFRVTSQKITDKNDTTPPDLEITENVQTGPMLILNGRTEPGALLWVDNEKVEVTDDGTFYAVIRLRKEGVNEVVLMAQDAAGNVRKITHKAYVDPY